MARGGRCRNPSQARRACLRHRPHVRRRGVGLSYNTRPERAGYRIPGRAAAALYHGKLDPKLGKDRDAIMRAAREWAASTYTPALARLASLSEAERSGIARDLALYTGLTEAAINRDKLELAPREYLAALLKDQGKTLDTFDMRITGGEGADARLSGSMPIFAKTSATRQTSPMLAWVAVSTKRTRPPTPSRPTSTRCGTTTPARSRPRSWPRRKPAKARPAHNPGPSTQSKLDPKLRVMVAAGVYDSLNNCTENDALLQKLESKIAANFVMRCYAGGHMMYRDPAESVRLSADIHAFISGAR